MTDTEKLHETLDASVDYWQASCAMVVLRNKETVLRCCYGFANQEKGLPFTENTRISLPCSGGFGTLCLLFLRKHEFLTGDKPADVPMAALVRELTGKSVAEFLAEFVLPSSVFLLKLPHFPMPFTDVIFSTRILTSFRRKQVTVVLQ